MSDTATLRIGTRASALALWQARHVAAAVAAQPGAPRPELVHIRTSGDAQTEVPLWQVGGRAFFTREIDAALLAGTVDVAVHSLKDLATELPAGVTLAATLPRADPRDALVSRGGVPLAALPPGARIGTSSLRRRAFGPTRSCSSCAATCRRVSSASRAATTTRSCSRRRALCGSGSTTG